MNTIPTLQHDNIQFPSVETAIEQRSGCVAVGGDLSIARLQAAYRLGIFPWYQENQAIYWWALAPRMVLYPKNLHIPRSLLKTIKQQKGSIRINHAFSQVIQSCATQARPEQDGTWITPEMQAAYIRLHHAGYAHSFEYWQTDTSGSLKLQGGLYGVQIGRVFFGESMFAQTPDSSKQAFVYAVHYLAECGIEMIDCQMHTAHLARFGAKLIEWPEFKEKLATLHPQKPIKPIEKSILSIELIKAIARNT